MLAGNLLILMLMAAMIGSQLFLLMREWRRGTPGAGLHMRLALLFSLVAVVPAIIVAVFAYVTLNRGLDTWFSQRTQAIVNSAVGVAEDYIRSAAEATRNDAASISADLVQQKDLYDNWTGRTSCNAWHGTRRYAGLSGAFVFDHRAKRIDASVTADNSVKFLVPCPT